MNGGFYSGLYFIHPSNHIIIDDLAYLNYMHEGKG